MNYAVASSQLCPNSYNPRSYSSSQNTVENRRGQRTHHPARRLSNRIGGANNLPVGSRWPLPTLPLQPRHQRQSRNGPRLPPATAAMASRMNRREHPGPNQSAAASSSTAGLVRNQPRWTASPSPRRVRRCCRRPDFPLFFSPASRIKTDSSAGRIVSGLKPSSFVATKRMGRRFFAAQIERLQQSRCHIPPK